MDDWDWMREGLCQDDPEMWFADRDSISVRVARAICHECPVLLECREYTRTLRKSLLQGVWAGKIH